MWTTRLQVTQILMPVLGRKKGLGYNCSIISWFPWEYHKHSSALTQYTVVNCEQNCLVWGATPKRTIPKFSRIIKVVLVLIYKPSNLSSFVNFSKIKTFITCTKNQCFTDMNISAVTIKAHWATNMMHNYCKRSNKVSLIIIFMITIIITSGLTIFKCTCKLW